MHKPNAKAESVVLWTLVAIGLVFILVALSATVWADKPEPDPCRVSFTVTDTGWESTAGGRFFGGFYGECCDNLIFQFGVWNPNVTLDYFLISVDTSCGENIRHLVQSRTGLQIDRIDLPGGCQCAGTISVSMLVQPSPVPARPLFWPINDDDGPLGASYYCGEDNCP